MAAQACRALDIVTADLEPAIYDQRDLLDAVQRLALASPRTRVRILVRNPQPAVTRGHRLLELARRLPSSIEIRVPALEHADYAAAFFVADATGVVYRVQAERYEATVNFHDPRQARQLLHEVDEMWQVAKPDPNLRRLPL